MSLIQVGYMVPVEVIIDTETKTVQRVVVIDEDIKYDRNDAAKDGKSIHTDSYDEVTDPALRATALYVVEHEEWPAWEIGW